MEEVKFVAYWNGSVENPIISKEIDLSNSANRLVIVTLDLVPDSRQTDGSHDITIQKRNLRKFNKELQNLTRATKRLK